MICKLKDFSKLINIIQKGREKRTQKIPTKELHASQVKAKQKQEKIYKAVVNLFRDSPHPDLVFRGKQLNCNKSQITGFNKTRDTRAGNLSEQTVVMKVNKNK